MRLLILIAILIVSGLLIWSYLPTGTFGGEEEYDVEVSATVSHGILSLPQSFDLYGVSYKVIGVSKNYDIGKNLFGIGTYQGSFEFCIDKGTDNERCQWNDEEFSQFTFGESRASTEIITNVKKGSHELSVNFYTDNTLRDTYTEGITI